MCTPLSYWLKAHQGAQAGPEHVLDSVFTNIEIKTRVRKPKGNNGQGEHMALSRLSEKLLSTLSQSLWAFARFVVTTGEDCQCLSLCLILSPCRENVALV